MHLDGSAVCGGEERKRESEESFNHKNILFSQILSPFIWVKAHQLLHRQLKCYLQVTQNKQKLFCQKQLSIIIFIIITKTFLAIWGIKRKKTRVVEKELIEKQSLFPHDLYYIIYANIFIHVLMCMLTLHDDDQMFYIQSVIIIACSPKINLFI